MAPDKNSDGAVGFVSVISSGPDRRKFTFSEAALLGWAPDGGMFWPEPLPRLDCATLRAWALLPYAALCSELLKLFILGDPEMSPAEVDEICTAAFAHFGSAATVEVKPLPVPSRVAGGGGVAAAAATAACQWHVAELWHGPTLAFKDLGMAVLCRTLGYLLRQRKRTLTLLVGTSGDTGSAAMEAVRGMGDVLRLLVLYPLQGFSAITPTQEAQMASVPPTETHVHLVGVEGSSDDLDVPMEARPTRTPPIEPSSSRRARSRRPRLLCGARAPCAPSSAPAGPVRRRRASATRASVLGTRSARSTPSTSYGCSCRRVSRAASSLKPRAPALRGTRSCPPRTRRRARPRLPARRPTTSTPTREWRPSAAARLLPSQCRAARRATSPPDSSLSPSASPCGSSRPRTASGHTALSSWP